MSSPLNQILFELGEIKSYIKSLPEWTPISKQVAIDKGYKTTDGLRKWCENNLHPDDFQKFGRVWHIRTAVFQRIKNKM